jgi:imidazolonepropionase-like amidohydrolase
MLLKTPISARFCLFLATLPAFAEVTVFRNFTLIDGTGRPAQPGSAMIVDNGRIQWIGPVARLKVPAGAEQIDASGKYIMPGLINLHGHVGNTVDLTQNGKFFTRENIEKNLNTYAAYGVTTVLSLGTDQDLIFTIRSEQRAGRPTYARVYTAGQGFTFKGSTNGMPGVTFSLTDASEAAKDVDELAAKKVDIVKMWVDDGLGRLPKMPLAVSQAIIDNAHRHGLRVAAHIFYYDDAMKLTEGGVDALAHSVRDKPVDQPLIDAMKQHHTWQMAATLTREESVFIYAKTPEFLSDPFFTRSVSQKTIDTLRDPDYQKRFAADPNITRYPGFLKMAQENLKRLADAGIPYGMGTDSGPPARFPGFFEQWELELMVESGLTPSQAITAATKSGAEFLHAYDLGTIEKGKWADLIVLSKNPLDDIRNTRAIEAVYIAGNRVSRLF